MFTLTLSLDSLSLYIVVFDVVALLIYVLYLFHQKRKLENSLKNITTFISDYFINTGAEVEVNCYKIVGEDNRFAVLIQSEPLKRFRYSFILESNLISHTFKRTGCIVDKIYWRFPVQVHKDPTTEESPVEQIDNEDNYFSDVQKSAQVEMKYEVSETSWDAFNKSE